MATLLSNGLISLHTRSATCHNSQRLNTYVRLVKHLFLIRGEHFDVAWSYYTPERHMLRRLNTYCSVSRRLKTYCSVSRRLPAQCQERLNTSVTLTQHILDTYSTHWNTCGQCFYKQGSPSLYTHYDSFHSTLN